MPKSTDQPIPEQLPLPLDIDDYLSPGEAAEILWGVSDDTVRRWIASGIIDAVNVSTGARPRFRLRRVDVLELHRRGLPDDDRV